MTDHPPFQRRPAARKPRKTSGGLLRRLPQWLWLGLLGVIIVWMGVRYVLPAELGDEKGKKGKQTESSSKSKRSKGDESESEASKEAKSSKDQPKGVKATVRSWLGLETGKKKKGDQPKKPRKEDNPEHPDFEFTSTADFGLPRLLPTDQLVRHRTYTLSYNEDAEQANWVAYVLRDSDVDGIASRKDDQFKDDPKVKTRSAQLQDYRSSGFDRGHLLPSADRKGSEEDQAETFYLSNVSPQVHAMNSGTWEHAESQVRDWARIYGKLYVVTGPCLKPLPTQTIGPNRVAVPQAFYKIVLYADGRKSKMIGFWVPNKGAKQPLAAMVVPVDEIEEKTGYDFFPQIPDEVEKRLESGADISLWP